MSDGCGGVVGIDPTSLLSPGSRRRGGAAAPPSLPRARPPWSSDGSRLAYVVTSRGTATAPGVHVWIHEATTGEARRLEECLGGMVPKVDISPDGSLIAYLSYIDGSGTVPARWSRSVSTQARGPGSSPSLPGRGGPRFRRTAVRLPCRCSGEIRRIPGRRQRLGGRHRGQPDATVRLVEAADAWSPDGNWIAYTQSGGLASTSADDQTALDQAIESSGTGIVVVGADGSESRVVATGSGEGSAAYPTWSADSASVAYLRHPTTARGNGRG